MKQKQHLIFALTKDIIFFAFFTPRSPALRPAGRTSVRSKCSLHFSAFFADYIFICVYLRSSVDEYVVVYGG
jgi:hypothetical protein